MRSRTLHISVRPISIALTEAVGVQPRHNNAGRSVERRDRSAPDAAARAR
jgi:hypothetical protein